MKKIGPGLVFCGCVGAAVFQQAHGLPVEGWLIVGAVIAFFAS